MSRYFKVWDLTIYIPLLIILSTLFYLGSTLVVESGSKGMVYVDNKLIQVIPLNVNKEDIFIDTSIGGVNLEVKDGKIRATSSFSPLKLIVKQGFISKKGETLIGVPDKMIVKIQGGEGKKREVDFILR